MTALTPRPWRQNPNLVECFDSCVAMFAHARSEHDRATSPTPTAEIPPSNTDESKNISKESLP